MLYVNDLHVSLAFTKYTNSCTCTYAHNLTEFEYNGRIHHPSTQSEQLNDNFGDKKRNTYQQLMFITVSLLTCVYRREIKKNNELFFVLSTAKTSYYHIDNYFTLLLSIDSSLVIFIIYKSIHLYITIVISMHINLLISIYTNLFIPIPI